MKERILSGWNFRRWMYFILGLIMVISSVIDQFWIGILFGVYFTSMGLFAFGCASGNCYPSREITDSQVSRKNKSA